jgi:flagellar protein FlgJ
MDIARTLVQKATEANQAQEAIAPAATALDADAAQRLTAAAVKFESFFVAQMMK